MELWRSDQEIQGENIPSVYDKANIHCNITTFKAFSVIIK